MGERRIRIADRGGPYDVETERLRQKFSAEAVMTIVLSGSEGTGFSVSAPDSIKPHLPALFHAIGDEVAASLATEQNALFCPVCRAPLTFDPRQGLHGATIPNGSITVCAACASFITLDETWRVLTEAELAEIDDDLRIALTRTRRQIERRRMSNN